MARNSNLAVTYIYRNEKSLSVLTLILALFTALLLQEAKAEHVSAYSDSADNISISDGLSIENQKKESLIGLESYEYSKLTRGARSDLSQRTTELILAEESTGYSRGSRFSRPEKSIELTLTKESSGYLRGARH